MTWELTLLVQVAIAVFAPVGGARGVWVIKRYYLYYFGNNQLTKLSRGVPCHVLGPLMMCHVTINFANIRQSYKVVENVIGCKFTPKTNKRNKTVYCIVIEVKII